MNWLPKKSVVVPVDFSEESLAALDVALQMVDRPQQLHVIHVLPELNVAEPGVIWDSIDDKSRCQHADDALREKLSDPKYVGLNLHSVVGDAGHKIADYAAECKAELIVLPSHGRTGLKRLLIGSVAERVVRLSHCPVLVLRK
ncbi:MAG: universal stress protein [Pirellulaceae bacterium]